MKHSTPSEYRVDPYSSFVNDLRTAVTSSYDNAGKMNETEFANIKRIHDAINVVMRENDDMSVIDVPQPK